MKKGSSAKNAAICTSEKFSFPKLPALVRHARSNQGAENFKKSMLSSGQTPFASRNNLLNVPVL